MYHISNGGFNKTWAAINNIVQITDEGLRPNGQIIFSVHGNPLRMVCVEVDGKFYRRTMEANAVHNVGCYGEVSWRRRDAK